MNCQDFQLMLSAELDGALTASQASALQAHLEVCSSCRAEKAQFQEWDRLVRAEASYDQEPPLRIWNAIEAGIRQRQPATPAMAPQAQPAGIRQWLAGWLQTPQLRLAAAALAVVLVCGLALMQMGPGESERLLAELDAISGPESTENPYLIEYMEQESRPRNPFSGM
ncbi:MAG TPA: zf-HC2 domain-containing protein [Acidobacteriota bacterium]|nr:zf-HC2 domain-containing protein [Acidobacteriota bacterium]